MKALEDFALWLRWHHCKYTIEDVRPSVTPDNLKMTKACSCTYPPFDGSTVGVPKGSAHPHYHTLFIGGYRKGYGRGYYAWWRAVKNALETPRRA
ncbi:MAG TPA: hypothetical protein VFB12_10430 [Ktedonobacteraceae bacterium]|nr:hypothetical protein [Ktedonobacteraceae bacterium]